MTMSNQAGDDLRGMPRAKSFMRARITFNNQRSTLDCVIRNLSAAGARLQLHNGHLAPAEFDIFVPQRNRTYRAKTVWRGDECLGVSFPDTESGALSDDQIRALAAENEQLRERVRRLTRELADAKREG